MRYCQWIFIALFIGGLSHPVIGLEPPSPGTKQVFDMGSTGDILASPSATKVCLGSSERGTGEFAVFFVHDPEHDRWKKLPPMQKKGLGFTPVHWIKHQDYEALAITDWDDKAISLEGEVTIVEGVTFERTEPPIFEAETGRMTAPRTLVTRDEVTMIAIWEALRQCIPADMPEPELARMGERLDGLKLYEILDIYMPDGTILIHQTSSDDYDGTLELLNLTTGTSTRFAVQDRNHRVEQADARFSPDGKHVLIVFGYGPDHVNAECPGYIQLFSVDGTFVTELDKFDTPGPGDFWNPGDVRWLHNNWIVYTTPSRLVFWKFPGEDP